MFLGRGLYQLPNKASDCERQFSLDKLMLISQRLAMGADTLERVHCLRNCCNCLQRKNSNDGPLCDNRKRVNGRASQNSIDFCKECVRRKRANEEIELEPRSDPLSTAEDPLAIICRGTSLCLSDGHFSGTRRRTKLPRPC